MEDWIHGFLTDLPWIAQPWLAWSILLGVVAISLGVLAKGADWLVEEAVSLSKRSGIPKVVIGATIVSLGTTMPEVAVSVLAALKGKPDVALGNAVGSVICDTGLILGLAALIAPLPLNRRIVNRQGWVQLAAGILLVLCCIPWNDISSTFETGGRLHQLVGIVFLVLLAWYLWQSVRWARLENVESNLNELEKDVQAATGWILGKLVVGIAMVVLAAQVLIPTVSEAALRLHVPPGVVAATIVAFGTSLPELTTAVSAARRGHGELAVGNVVGADILNVLFVAGASAAVTTDGLAANAEFFYVFFPGMLFVLFVFRIGIYMSGSHMKAGFGYVLLGTWLIVTAAGYLFA